MITQQQAIEALERVYYATHASFIDRNLVRQYIEQGAAPGADVVQPLSDDELQDLAHSAYEEALSFGLSVDTFLRYFKGIRKRAAIAQERKA